MWCETQARRPRARQNVLLSSAPQASTWRPAGTGSASRLGTAPRERRSGSGRPPATRSTESSTRVWIGRSWLSDEVGDRRQPLERVVVLVGDRLVGDVAAGHHQRLADVGQQQVMQRAVGEHHAELGRARRHRRAPRARRGGGGRARSAGRARPAARSPPARARRARARPRGRGAISANGFSSRCLRARSRATASSSLGQAREMEPADPLDRHDAAVAQQRDDLLERMREARPAGGAGVRLGVEAAVRRGRRTRPRRRRTS